MRSEMTLGGEKVMTNTAVGAETDHKTTLKVKQKDIIRFDEGILGFPNSHSYILIPHEPGSPFAWLQSVDEDNLAFLLINPAIVKPDYVVKLPQEVTKDLKLTDVSDGLVLAIVVVPEDPRKMRMNLRAPVVINTRERLGRQVVLEDTSLEIRYPILSEEEQAKQY
ncbi:MAG: flagellar assembly protein FliW [Candidatus Coatesbacteria bacterium]|nr:MAG: flagellar assembly protein FliW [Candidatus Coatesbacteria bacterium]HDM59102.1 flagellar assembly protein FliW [Bacillota bacterium]